MIVRSLRRHVPWLLWSQEVYQGIKVIAYRFSLHLIRSGGLADLRIFNATLEKAICQNGMESVVKFVEYTIVRFIASLLRSS